MYTDMGNLEEEKWLAVYAKGEYKSNSHSWTPLCGE